jgi:hypothetical protein
MTASECSNLLNLSLPVVAKNSNLRNCLNAQLSELDHTASSLVRSGRWSDMLYSSCGTSAHRNSSKFAAMAAAMTLLSGCAIAVPVRPPGTSYQDSRDGDFYCRADPKCSHSSPERRIAYRRSQSGDGDQADDPPDFILNGFEKEGTMR